MFKNITSNLLSFDKMISEQIIKLVYYIGLLYIAFTFLSNIYESFTSGAAAFLPLLLKSIVMVILAILVWRVICECIIIVFRMYARLGDINKALGGQNVEAAIPGDEMLNEVRDAALKAKAAATEKAKSATEKAKTLKSSISKDDTATAKKDLKPAAKTPVKKPVKKASTAATKINSAAKKTASKAKTSAKKTTSAATSKAKKTASKAKSATKTTSTKKT